MKNINPTPIISIYNQTSFNEGICSTRIEHRGGNCVIKEQWMPQEGWYKYWQSQRIKFPNLESYWKENGAKELANKFELRFKRFSNYM